MKTIYSRRRIEKKVNQITHQIATDIRDGEIKDPVFLIVLDGAMFFATDILKRLSVWEIYPEMSTVKIKSYVSNGKQVKPKVTKDWDIDLNGRDVIIIEDIVDSGNTLRFLLEKIYHKQTPTSIRVASLLKRKNSPCYVDYLGFIVEKDRWIVGYGLDNNGKQRNLADIISIN